MISETVTAEWLRERTFILQDHNNFPYATIRQVVKITNGFEILQD